MLEIAQSLCIEFWPEQPVVYPRRGKFNGATPTDVLIEALSVCISRPRCHNCHSPRKRSSRTCMTCNWETCWPWERAGDGSGCHHREATYQGCSAQGAREQGDTTTSLVVVAKKEGKRLSCWVSYVPLQDEVRGRRRWKRAKVWPNYFTINHNPTLLNYYFIFYDIATYKHLTSWFKVSLG
jgi:hypothetical protein